MKIIDISLSIKPDLPTWPGDPGIQLERISKMEEGANANVTHMSMGVHAGTHVDAPFHFLGGDSETVESLSLEALVGPATVIRLPDTDLISAAVLERAQLPRGATRLLFKTRNSEFWQRAEKDFKEDFVALSAEASQFLVDHGAVLVGVDYLSVAPFKDSVPTHRILLEAGIVALEGLDLSGVEAGDYQLICLPIKIEGSDGAPARAILVDES
jgi:arylformamidase